MEVMLFSHAGSYIKLPGKIAYPIYNQNSAIFPTRSLTKPEIWFPIYDRYGWYSRPKNTFWRGVLWSSITMKKYLL